MNFNDIKSLFDGFSLDENGILEFDKCSLVELAKEYGTPSYVYSSNVIRKKIKEFKDAFLKSNVEFEILYAGKAFLTKEMCRILISEGLSLDAVSGGEIYTALKVNFPKEKIYFHGNNKSYEELEFAIREKIGNIMVDNDYELDRIEKIAKKLNKQVKIMIRVTPGVDPHTHKHIRTGGIDSKFGISIDKVIPFIKNVLSKERIIYNGLHFHIGSQIFDLEPYDFAIKEVVKLIKEIKENFGLETKNLDVGGGLGARYTKEDNPPPIESFVSFIVNSVKSEVKKYDLNMPKILIEPGRSIIAEAGITLYTIGAIKETPFKKYVLIDGGMADNPRHILYNARYEATIANKVNDTKKEVVTVAGKACESGDILIESIELPKPEVNDILVVFSTGAYTYSMSSNYNRFPRPPVILVDNGKSKVIVKKETYEDIVRNDL